MRWVFVWIVRLTILLPLLVLRQVSETAELWYDRIEEWTE